MHAGVTERHFKEKLPRVLGLGNTTPDAATMTTAVRGLMFGDYIVPGELLSLHVKHTLCQCHLSSSLSSTLVSYRAKAAPSPAYKHIF